MIHSVGPMPDPCIILCVIESNPEKVPSAPFVAFVQPVIKCTTQFKIGDGDGSVRYHSWNLFENDKFMCA